ncbi:MAG: STM4011 family radical SAM protein [Polyangiales bacterium]
MRLSILYRGPLASCNYACGYCPFAKRRDDREALARDYEALERFVAWVERSRTDALSVLFTPWGEALIREPYRKALVHLSRLAHVERVAIQTNLSVDVGFAADADPRKLAFWATYHPSEVDRDRFVAKVLGLRGLGIRTSVGLVGLPAHREEALALRAALPEDVYLWINAAKRTHGAYGEEELRFFERIDPLFALNTEHHASLGKACATGVDTISVDGDGRVRRCHFVEEELGRLHDDSFRAKLGPRPCPSATCGCHIGYVHLERLRLRDRFDGGVLERVPADWPQTKKVESGASVARSSTTTRP